MKEMYMIVDGEIEEIPQGFADGEEITEYSNIKTREIYGQSY